MPTRRAVTLLAGSRPLDRTCVRHNLTLVGRKSHLRNVAFVVAVLLALVSLCVGVAWLCAAFASLDPGQSRVLRWWGDAPRPTAGVVEGFGRTRIDWVAPGPRSPPPDIHAQSTVSPDSPRDCPAYSVEDAGWPFRCMRATVDGSVLIISTDIRGVNGVVTWGTSPSSRIYSNALALPDEQLGGVLALQSTWRALPLQPLWAGLAANTCVYLAVLLASVLCLRLVRAMVRRRRNRRGVCPKCAHPLAGRSRCPECGTLAGAGRSLAEAPTN